LSALQPWWLARRWSDSHRRPGPPRTRAPATRSISYHIALSPLLMSSSVAATGRIQQSPALATVTADAPRFPLPATRPLPPPAAAPLPNHPRRPYDLAPHSSPTAPYLRPSQGPSLRRLPSTSLILRRRTLPRRHQPWSTPQRDAIFGRAPLCTIHALVGTPTSPDVLVAWLTAL
jgi:hypothetical protein